MKPLIYCMFFQIVLIQPVISQNFECIKENDIYYYDRIIAEPDAGQPPVRAYRVDSTITSGNDQVLFTQKEIIDRDPGNQDGCWDPDAGSWIGNVRVSPEGDYYFNNDVYVYNFQTGDYVNVHEEMLIKSQATVGDTWTFYSNDSLGDFAYAEVTDFDTLDVLGTVDSVKYISVKRISDDELLFVIRVSKNYGLHRAINFRDYFPGGFYPFNMSTNYYEVFELTGIEGSDTGVHKLTIGDVYDFDAGDEFDVLAEVDSEEGFILEFIYYINTVIEKSYSTNGDTLYYMIDSLSWVISDDSVVLNRDTIVNAYYDLDQLLPDDQYLPFETKYYDSSDVSYMGMFRYDYERIHFFDQYQYYSSQENDTCFQFPFDYNRSRTLDWVFTEFIEGCGSYVMQIRSDGYSCEYCSVLMYYYKAAAEEAWGEPLDPPVGLEENTQNTAKLSIYPNPVDENLHIKCSDTGPASVKNYMLINSSGALVYKISTKETEITIGMDRFTPGPYLLFLSTDDGFVCSRKLIKE